MRMRLLEQRVFARRLGANRPVVTPVLLVLIGLAFALELLWGDPGSVPLLGRMGAITRPRLFAGEWWRLMSCGVLHGSVMHFGFNAYVLWVLGRGTERLLGSARFLVLFVVSALVAALGSALVMDTLSVGASGAIWGLLGAQAVFGFGAHGYVPSVARPALRKAAGTNLLLNVFVSFLPHVDWAAHFAGGAAGAALVASGLLLRGLPKLTDPEPEPGPRGSRRAGRIAAGLGLLYALGAGLGLLSGRAWELKRPLEYIERTLPELGATLRLPTLVGRGRTELREGWKIHTFGIESGPLIVALQRLDLDPTELDAGLAQEHAALRREMSRLGEGLELVSAPETLEREGRLVTEMRRRNASGTSYDIAVVIEPPYLWKVEVLTWPDWIERYAGAARTIATSLWTTSLHTTPAER